MRRWGRGRKNYNICSFTQSLPPLLHYQIFTLDKPGPEGLQTQYCAQLNKLKKLSGSASYLIQKDVRTFWLVQRQNLKLERFLTLFLTCNVSSFMVSIGLVTSLKKNHKSHSYFIAQSIEFNLCHY